MLLLCGVVCFLYFNEQWLTHGQTERRQTLRNLADQLAAESYVPFAADNRVSLNVLVSRLASRTPVMSVTVETLDNQVLSSAGKPLGETIRVTSAIGDADQVIGRVVVHGKAIDNLSSLAFIALLLLLAGIRIALYMLWSKLVPLTDKVKTWRSALPRPSKLREPMMSLKPALPVGDVLLTLSISNFDKLNERLTPTALQGVLVDYQQTLNNVMAVYGMATQPLDKKLTFKLPYVDQNESLFLLVCAATLFKLCCQQIDKKRHAQGDVCLAFDYVVALEQAPDVELQENKLLLVTDSLDAQLINRLDYQLIEQWQKNNTEWYLLDVHQLVERYLKLIEAQSRSVLN